MPSPERRRSGHFHPGRPRYADLGDALPHGSLTTFARDPRAFQWRDDMSNWSGHHRLIYACACARI
eukprot:7304461-Pyramimonas_sp.AAC.1